MTFLKNKDKKVKSKENKSLQLFIPKKRLSKLQREVLIGILLGDAHLRGNKQKSKYSLCVLQSEKHKEYCFIYTQSLNNLLAHRQRNIFIFSKTKDFQVSYMLDGVLQLLANHILDLCESILFKE